MAKLKVFGMTTIVLKEDRTKITHEHRNQVRYVAAVFSAKEFASLLNTNLFQVKNYASITGNKKEIDLAIANPHKAIFMEER